MFALEAAIRPQSYNAVTRVALSDKLHSKTSMTTCIVFCPHIVHVSVVLTTYFVLEAENGSTSILWGKVSDMNLNLFIGLTLRVSGIPARE
ncbi:hypothetical protein NPIL_520581 [Nephila pilipes]|uniref:Uncharacterized protein n=1 Tax=Nephila pilipes TaxID=299642 RepID=A0A8X6T6Y6_NEPPI|nr:hypothetical protein NPIL_520581 [Nephila pilipes]